jgi:hypothetical protein
VDQPLFVKIRCLEFTAADRRSFGRAYDFPQDFPSAAAAPSSEMMILFEDREHPHLVQNV